MIKIEDLSLRDGMQQLNIPKTYNKQKKIFKVLMDSEIDSIEFRMLDSLEDIKWLNEATEYIKEKGKTITLLVILSDKYMKLLERVTNKECLNIKILIPFSEMHFQVKINSDRLTHAKKMDYLIKKNFLHKYNSVQIILEDVTSVPFDEAQRFMDIIFQDNRKKIDCIILADTKGQMLPNEIFELCKSYIDNYPEFIFGFHAHNDMGLATANTLSAVEAGIKKIEGCFLGIGERAGNVALEEIILILNQRYEHEYNIKKLMDILKKLSLIYKIIPQCNSILIGEGYTKHTSGIHQNAESKKKGLYTFINGLEYQMPLNALSSKEKIKEFYDSEEFVYFYRKINKYFEMSNEEIKILYDIKKEKNEKVKN